MDKGTRKNILMNLRIAAKGIRMIHTMGWYRDPEARPPSKVCKDRYYQKIIEERKYPLRSLRETWIETGRINGVISTPYAGVLKKNLKEAAS